MTTGNGECRVVRQPPDAASAFGRTVGAGAAPEFMPKPDSEPVGNRSRIADDAASLEIGDLRNRLSGPSFVLLRWRYGRAEVVSRSPGARRPAAGRCPTIARRAPYQFVYGIAIYMYWRDHEPPHFHVQYDEHWAELAIEDGQLLNGALPPRAMRMVEEWRGLHEGELRDNWHRVQRPAPPVQIEPLP